MSWFAKLLLLIGVPAIAVGIGQTFLITAQDPVDVGFDAAVGRVLAFALVPMLIVAPWNWWSARAERRRLGAGAKPRVNRGAMFIGWTLMALMVYGSTVGISHRAEQRAAMGAPQIYRGPGCDLAVWFPGTPTVTKLDLATDRMSGEQAELLLKDSYLRAECVAYAEPMPLALVDARAYMENFVSRQGLEGVSYTWQDQAYGVAVGARGNKKFAGEEATYEVLMIFRPSSMLALITAARSAQYPTESVTTFRRSIHPGL